MEENNNALAAMMGVAMCALLGTMYVSLIFVEEAVRVTVWLVMSVAGLL